MTVLPAIDYTDKDFRSLREAMLRLAAQRLPEWTDRSPGDLGMLLIDLFAYMGDVAFYYQDRIANELFPATAVEPRSIVDLLHLVGYQRSPVTAARADLLLTFEVADAPTVTVPHGAVFRAPGGPEFRYLGPQLEIALASSRVRRVRQDDKTFALLENLPVEQSTAVPTAVIGSARGEPNETFPLAETGVLRDSVVVEVDEGGGIWERWVPRDGRLTHPDERRYDLLVDADGRVHVVFGADRVPPPGTANVRATYRTSRGAAGNVAAGTIAEAVTKLGGLRVVVNPLAAAGGSDLERPEDAIRRAPLAFRSLDRAVTESDYVALALATGAVTKVRAHSEAWNQLDLHVAPAGPSLRPVPEALRLWLLAYFEDKRMAGTLVRIVDAEAATIDIALELTIDRRYSVDPVVADTRSAVAALFDFAAVDFGQTLFASDVYAVAEAVPGVTGVLVRRFRRRDTATGDVEAELARHNLPALDDLPAFVRDAIASEVPADGRIELGDFELPALGELELTTRSGAPE